MTKEQILQKLESIKHTLSTGLMALDSEILLDNWNKERIKNILINMRWVELDIIGILQNHEQTIN